VPEHGVRVFKSIGLGLEDVAAAAVVWEKVGAGHARPPVHQK
jgi:ornithine cyclodeaminase/alanine dehydrogenase-like protein (mu-crystallin family)